MATASRMVLALAGLAAHSANAVVLKGVSGTSVEQLRGGVDQLIGALDEFLLDSGVSPMFWPQAVRAALGMEGKRLKGSGDEAGANLFHNFVDQVPLADIFGPDWAAVIRGLSGGNVAESVQIRTGADGKTVKTVTHCDGGHCTNTSEVMDAEQRPLISAAKSNHTGGDIQQVVAGMADSLKDLMDAGFGKFQDALTDAISKALPEDGPAEGPAMAAEQDGAMDKVFRDMFGSWADLPKGNVTSSTEVRIENGKLVQVTKRCENGVCTTDRHEEAAPAAQIAAADL